MALPGAGGALTVKGCTQAAGVSTYQDRRAAASESGPCEGAQRTTLRQAQAELDAQRLHLLHRLPQLVTVLDRLPKSISLGLLMSCRQRANNKSLPVRRTPLRFIYLR